MFRRPSIQRFSVMIGIGAFVSGCFLEIANAQQFDAPFLVHQEKNKDKWAAEDKEVDAKLAALEQKFGKKPNIIMVLTDDIGWGTLGAYGGGKVVGAPTPNLDKLARDGIKFLSAYSEPSCTPTRLALLTGRQPHRTGVNVVLWPGQKQGLVAEEVTIAELLRDGGYDTAMWGKWHVGDVYDEQLPHNQGFDYAEYSPYNGAVWGWQDSADYHESMRSFGSSAVLAGRAAGLFRAFRLGTTLHLGRTPRGKTHEGDAGQLRDVPRHGHPAHRRDHQIR